MYIVTVDLKGTLGVFPDGEAFLNLDDARDRAAEWAALDTVAAATVTTIDRYFTRAAEDTGLLVGLGLALGYEVEFEDELVAA